MVPPSKSLFPIPANGRDTMLTPKSCPRVCECVVLLFGVLAHRLLAKAWIPVGRRKLSKSFRHPTRRYQKLARLTRAYWEPGPISITMYPKVRSVLRTESFSRLHGEIRKVVRMLVNDGLEVRPGEGKRSRRSGSAGGRSGWTSVWFSGQGVGR